MNRLSLLTKLRRRLRLSLGRESESRPQIDSQRQSGIFCLPVGSRRFIGTLDDGQQQSDSSSSPAVTSSYVMGLPHVTTTSSHAGTSSQVVASSQTATINDITMASFGQEAKTDVARDDVQRRRYLSADIVSSRHQVGDTDNRSRISTDRKSSELKDESCGPSEPTNVVADGQRERFVTSFQYSRHVTAAKVDRKNCFRAPAVKSETCKQHLRGIGFL